MDPILLEMASIYSGDPFDFLEGDEENSLMHYGVGVDDGAPGIGSGRYPKGSGDNPYQHGVDFLSRVDMLKKSGVTKPLDIAKAMGCRNTTDYRIEYTRALNDWKRERAAQAQKMLDSGMKKKAVAQKLGIRDSTLASWLNPKSLERVSAAQNTANFLEDQVKSKKMIDVGEGVEKELNVSKEKLREALAILESKGYVVYGGRVPQATNPGKQTTLKVLAMPDESWSDLYHHPEKIKSVRDYVRRETEDGKEIFEKKWKFPASMDSKRLMIRFADDVAPDGHTGVEKDGTIEIRRNVPDLDLQGSHYAQVRILVDGNKYLKGMAHYSDHMPDGIDVIFNTNKTRDQADNVLKNIKKDPDNPFGALLRKDGGQYMYTDKETGEQKLGLINKTRQEGDWEDWQDKLPSQFLAKQPMALINKQLGLAIADKKSEYADILAIENPTLRKALLNDFAESCDSDAVDMSAAALPRQKYQVILPVPTLKDNEVYAPNFKDGETLALVRFPHGGLFEIPILKVNNRNPQGREMIGENPIDAIGLNKTNADRLSGADFDGDTVMCIPCNDPEFSDTHVINRPPLEGLADFDPKTQYHYDKVETRIEKVKQKDGTYKEQEVDHYFRNGMEFKPMTRTGLEMGNVSNLIMDMTLKGAGPDELAAAVRHSMVVIDAEKHHLDWKQSEIDNHIRDLKKKYQHRIDESDGSEHYGASTLITRAKSPTQVIKPTGSPHIDPETGKLVYKDSQLIPQTYVDKQGKTQTRMMDVNLLETYDDARKLVSTYDPNNPDRIYTRSPKEAAYAQYSNALRAMANEARKEILVTGDIEFNRAAEKEYHEEAQHLLDEILISELNAPRERMAQLYARGVVLAKKRDNPDMTKKEIKKASNQALADGRTIYGASRHKINITPKEWEAIQAGAISPTKLTTLLKYADSDQVREYATPKTYTSLTTGQIGRIRSMLNDGTSASVIAEQMHVSVSTINKYRKEME